MRKSAKIFILGLILAACGNYAEMSETAEITDIMEITEISENSEISAPTEMAEMAETDFLVKPALERFIAEQPQLFAELEISRETILQNPLSAPFFNQHDETTWDFALLAAVNDEKIYLYGGSAVDGVILHYKGQQLFFEDWLWTGRTYPQVRYFADIRQLAIILPAGRGTGVSFDNLYILSFNELDETGGYTLAYLLGTAAHERLENMSIHSVENNSFVLDFFGEEILVELETELETEVESTVSNSILGVNTGNIANFEFCENAIISRIALGVEYERGSFGGFFGEVRSIAILANGEILLTEQEFWQY
ncbi:MAG: hypothetical protein FWG68_10175 [Defluviitaleaceae bacterium]|nr:hypothetical protein [Defluviitaleaceae bacterium]